MTSGVPWHMRGVRPEVIDSAREAARRSGMSVEEWLDTVIAESARHAGIDPTSHRLSDFDLTTDPAAGAAPQSSFADVSARLDAALPPSRSPEPCQRVTRPSPPSGDGRRHALDRRRPRAARSEDRAPRRNEEHAGAAPTTQRPTAPSIAPGQRRRPGAGRDRSPPAHARRRWPRHRAGGAAARPDPKLARPRAAASPDQRPHREHASLRHRRRGRDPARRPRRDRHDAQGSDAAAGDRGAGIRNPLAVVAHRQRAPCRRRRRDDGGRRARRSPKSATRCMP